MGAWVVRKFIRQWKGFQHKPDPAAVSTPACLPEKTEASRKLHPGKGESQFTS